jgi:hypothetical protein
VKAPTAAGKAIALVALGATTLLAITICAAAWIYATRAPGVDFASFWAAGRLAFHGQPALAYDVAAHRAVEMMAANMGGLMPFPYPPPFLFAVSLVGFEPYWLAYLAWIVPTAALYFVAARRLVPERFVFAHPAALVNAMIGQNGFLTASIFLGGLSLLATQPLVGGAVLGLLVIKPQLALLVPVALLAGREWRAMAAGSLSVLFMLSAAALLFGIDAYRGFVAMSGNYAGYMAADRWNWAEQASVFGFLRFFGVAQEVALSAQMAVAIAAAVLTWRAWSARSDERVALLASASLLVPPYVFTYDSLILMAPLAVLLRDEARAWRPALLWLLLAAPLFGYLGLYRGPNSVPIAAALCLYWMAAGHKKKAAAPSGTAAPVETSL